MKTLKVILITIVLLSLSACGRKPSAPSVSSGKLDSYPSFPSSYVSPRAIRVWTPSSYDPSVKYDVLYMHDGQMLFDSLFSWNHQEWGVDEALDSLMALGKVRPCIVVGIDNTKERLPEYCPDDVEQLLPSGMTPYKGLPSKGNAYLKFIVEELKPFVDSTYSTDPSREHTFMMGSSCGGLISSYALCKYPDVFGGVACLSTHCTLAYPDVKSKDATVGDAYREYLRTHLPPANTAKLYMDNGDGTLDGSYVKPQNAINEAILSMGWDGEHFMAKYYPGHSHCEDDWRSRLDGPLEFLLSR